MHLECRIASLATIAGSALAWALMIPAWSLAQTRSAPAGALTEDQYVDAVLAQGLDARVASSEAALGRAETVGAGAWPNPSLAWNREAARVSAGGTQDIISASIPLVLSGRLGREHDAAEQRALAAEAAAENARAQLRHGAVQTFGAVLIAQQRRAVLEASVKTLQTLAQAVAVREQAGAASGYDRVRIEVEQASIANQLRAVQANERRARAEALRLLGPTTKALPSLTGPLDLERPLPRLEVMLAALDEKRADARALALEAQAAETARRAAALRWVPDPTVDAGLQLLDVGGAGLETGYVVGISVPLPLFDHGQGEQARAATARDLARTRRAALLATARARLVAAFDDVTARREELRQHRTTVLAKTAELREIAAAAYRGGAAELLVLVDAERAGRDAQLTEIDLASALFQTETDLLLLSGAYDVSPSERAPR